MRPRVWTPLSGCRWIVELPERPAVLEVGIGRRQRAVEVLVRIGRVRGLAADVADGERHVARQFPLNVEAPLPHVALLAVGLQAPHAHRRIGARAAERIVERDDRLARTEAARGGSGHRIRDRVILLEARQRRHEIGSADLHEMLRAGVLARARADDPLRSSDDRQCRDAAARTAPPASRTSAWPQSLSTFGNKVGIWALLPGMVYGRSRLTVRTWPSLSYGLPI